MNYEKAKANIPKTYIQLFSLLNPPFLNQSKQEALGGNQPNGGYQKKIKKALHNPPVLKPTGIFFK